MTFKCKTRKYVIDELVIKFFKNYIQYNDSPESGGILVGKIHDKLIEITNCSLPNKYDKKSRYNFTRAYKPAQKFINKHFEKSDGRKIYLGEWHTHPEDEPIPSCIDKKSFDETLNKNKLNSDIHFMIIVGRIYLYVGIYHNKEIDESLTLKFNKKK